MPEPRDQALIGGVTKVVNDDIVKNGRVEGGLNSRCFTDANLPKCQRDNPDTRHAHPLTAGRCHHRIVRNTSPDDSYKGWPRRCR